MRAYGGLARRIASGFLLACLASQAEALCPAEQPSAQTPTDLALCKALDPIVRKPAALPLSVYEDRLATYLLHYCHRNRGAGWRSDKHVRDTGPFTLGTPDGSATGHDFGTHAPVIVWYSPDMLEWLKINRASEASTPAHEAAPIPDGAIMVKEMFPAPAAACAGADPARLRPTGGAAVMVRDNETARDGWFWGWFGWDGWAKDWPAAASSPYPNMGFGQYCVNCHASARDNQTFSSLRNIEGEAGEPLVFLSQGVIPTAGDLSRHAAVARAPSVAPAMVVPGVGTSFLKALGLDAALQPPASDVRSMPPMTYDNVWARPQAGVLDGFVTSNQCLGCHDAGSTGLQFDMTVADGDGRLLNVSPYGTWRSSPMGMAGRDPIFFAQLASEGDSFHKQAAALVQDTCLGCHGILGQRAFKTATKDQLGVCRSLSRDMLNVTPFPDADPFAALADYAGLARDGVSCVACHRMVFGAKAAAVHGQRQNACVDERRAFLTPGLSGFAASFTGSFDMGPEDVVTGPYEHPREMPMKHALGMRPAHDPAIASSELCGTCHTVHLPILDKGVVIGHTYEQTTYAEWAFSDYRTGNTPSGTLPLGAGAKAQSCQGCHMPGRDSVGRPTASKIASIQEYSDFPQTENNLGPKDIDLPVREGVARHSLVGLNLVFIEMARQFPEVLGLRAQDPMLLNKGVDPLVATERAMLDQADGRTASVAVAEVAVKDGSLDATVRIANHTGHKFPSGVGFRRAFVEFAVRDSAGTTLWVSGQTNKAGVILDGRGTPLDGEAWWRPDCSARLEPEARRHQPHYQIITRQDQVQIYEDLAAAPAADQAPRCSRDSPAQGPLTTSFLSRCTKVKDNRLLPSGFLSLQDRARIATALGAQRDLAEDAGPAAVGDDPDYVRGGGDTLRYRVPLSALAGQPASVQATLYYQATPPYYLQDRACTSRSADTKRLTFLAANLVLDGSAASWKLKVATTERIPVP